MPPASVRPDAAFNIDQLLDENPKARQGFEWGRAIIELGARIKRTMAEGQLVSDDVVEEVVKQRLDQHDWNYGFILDGFPRNSRQAAFFLETYDIDAVLLIDVPDAVVLERIVNAGSARRAIWITT